MFISFNADGFKAGAFPPPAGVMVFYTGISFLQLLFFLTLSACYTHEALNLKYKHKLRE